MFERSLTGTPPPPPEIPLNTPSPLVTESLIELFDDVMPDPVTNYVTDVPTDAPTMGLVGELASRGIQHRGYLVALYYLDLSGAS